MIFQTPDLTEPQRDPTTISKAYTEDSIWRNRDRFLTGTEAIVQFLTAKWEKEASYRCDSLQSISRTMLMLMLIQCRLRKELFAFTDNKIAVQFWYEYQDKHDGMKWKRCYGLEDWTFAEDGRMRKRQMSGNDVEIEAEERWFKDGVDVNAVNIEEKHW